MKELHIITKSQPASFWKRVLAYLIDIVIIDFIIVYPFRKFFESSAYSSYASIFTQPSDPKFIYISLSIMFLSLAYWVLLEWKIGQSIGKIMLNLHVVSKTQLTFMQALTRNITKPFPLALLIDVACMFFKKENQRLFERFSNTTVIETKWVLNQEKGNREKSELKQEENKTKR